MIRGFILAGALAVFVYTPWAHAGTVSAEGRCVALSDFSQMGPLVGQGAFDEGPTSGDIALNLYTGSGMTFKTGDLTGILAGVTTLGQARTPEYQGPETFFPTPIGGGGIQTGNVINGGGVVLFDVEVRRFGLTAGKNSTQYITAWDEAGVMIGQVTWSPRSDASFVGIDCGAQVIKMIAYSNDNLLAGEPLELGGSSNHSDHWVWSGNTSCANGVVNSGEECDDGNLDGTDSCTWHCKSAVCGDSFTWTGTEDCDDGNSVNVDDCLNTCVAPSCGDGFVWWIGGEKCDDANTDNTDDCTDTCNIAFCGDGHVWAGMEECDDGNMDQTDGCSNICKLPGCGDGVVEEGVEECDDGDDNPGDACTNDCTIAVCGDGVLRPSVEECDDGNEDDTDACPGCKTAVCGDRFVQIGVEECDDGNNVETDACLVDCTLNPDGGGTDGGTTTGATDGSGSGSGTDAGTDGSTTTTPTSGPTGTTTGTTGTTTTPTGPLTTDDVTTVTGGTGGTSDSGVGCECSARDEGRG